MPRVLSNGWFKRTFNKTQNSIALHDKLPNHFSLPLKLSITYYFTDINLIADEMDPAQRHKVAIITQEILSFRDHVEHFYRTCKCLIIVTSAY